MCGYSRRDHLGDKDEAGVTMINKPQRRLLYVPVTTRCNVNCKFCMRSTSSEDLPDDIMAKVLEILPTFEEADLTGYGEFLISRHRDAILSVLRKSGKRFLVSTNGLEITEELFKTMVSSGLRYINLDIKALTPSAMKELTGIDAVEQVVKAAKIIGKAKRGFTYGITMVLNKLNRQDVKAFADLALSTGADEIKLSPLIPVNSWAQANGIEWDSELRSLINSVLPDERKCGLNAFSPVVADAPVVCMPAFWHALIQINGTVVPCCLAPTYHMGNVRQTPFDEIWSGEKWTSFRNAIESGDYSLCGNCSHANMFKARLKARKDRDAARG